MSLLRNGGKNSRRRLPSLDLDHALLMCTRDAPIGKVILYIINNGPCRLPPGSAFSRPSPSKGLGERRGPRR